MYFLIYNSVNIPRAQQVLFRSSFQKKRKTLIRRMSSLQKRMALRRMISQVIFEVN